MIERTVIETRLENYRKGLAHLRQERAQAEERLQQLAAAEIRQQGAVEGLEELLAALDADKADIELIEDGDDGATE